MLLLFSMFAFALVFHAVTRPEAALEARFNTATSMLQASIESHSAGAQGAQGAQSAQSAKSAKGARAIVARGVLAEPVDPTEPAAVAEPVALAPVAFGAPVALAAPVAPAATGAPVAPVAPASSGALTRAVSHGGAALRTAFKKAF